MQSILLNNGIHVPGARKPAMTPEEKAAHTKDREAKRAKRDETMARKAALQATGGKQSKKEKREAKKAGG